MKKGVVLPALIGVLLVLVFTLAVPVAASEISTVDPVTAGTARTPQHFSVNESNNGDSIMIGLNDELLVVLSSTQSSGFRWKLNRISNPDVLQALSNTWIAPSSPTVTTGINGTEVWIFKALDYGISGISMEYNQPRASSANATGTFDINVNVKITGVPASTNLGMILMIAGFAGAGIMVFWLTARKRKIRL
jgi:predicted secreted protein